MTVGVLGDDLMVRVGPDDYEDALTRPAARPMDFTGKPMTGMVFVAATSLDDATLDSWIHHGLESQHRSRPSEQCPLISAGIGQPMASRASARS
jgi:hypothetical protein